MFSGNEMNVLSDNIVDFHNFISDNKLINEYKISSEPVLGQGTFGVVIKALNKIDNKEYAIKMIAITDYWHFHQKMKEMKIWATIEGAEHIARYRGAWLQVDQDSKKNFKKLHYEALATEEQEYFNWLHKSHDFAVLHIQMDLCSLSLKSAITQMQDYFGYSKDQLLPKMAYYISSEILYETLEALNHLHQLKPPVIHFDLKPNNILFKFTPNGHCIKLGHFGCKMAYNICPRNRNNCKHLAPELMRSCKPSTKVDVYSIGFVIQQLFNFDIRSNPSNANEKYTKIIDLAAKALSPYSENRPDCHTIMKQWKEWALDYCAVQQEVENMVDINAEYDVQKGFVLKFLQMKYKLDTNQK